MSEWAEIEHIPYILPSLPKISGSFSLEQLQQALILVQQRHPFLRVRILIDVVGLKYQPIQFVTDRDSAATSTGATSWKYL
jgi:hypothetical protein